MRESEIPEQRTGASSVTKYAIRCNNDNDAKSLYHRARLRLLDINSWDVFAGEGSAKFTLIDKTGMETSHLPLEGNYIRIAIPFIPGTSTDEEFEWVVIEKIKEQTTPSFFILIQVRPAVPPFSGKKETAHFFSKNATSTFSVEQKGNKVIAEVNGRNEKPNKGVHSLWSKLRNVVVAILAMMGLNKPQWKNLLKGLLQ